MTISAEQAQWPRVVIRHAHLYRRSTNRAVVGEGKTGLRSWSLSVDYARVGSHNESPCQDGFIQRQRMVNLWLSDAHSGTIESRELLPK